jgi:hypothetical protein
MAKKKKKSNQEPAEELAEIEKELSELDSDSINQFEKEERDMICRYIG